MKTILFAAAMLTSSAALAQPVQTPQAQPVIGQPAPARSLGGRGQGDRTRQQTQQMADTMFQRYDVNHDGTVTREEAAQALAQWTAARGEDGGPDDAARAQRMLDRMFGGAETVTQAQFEAQALARFDRQDLNHDGIVTAAERQQGRGNGAGWRQQ